MKTPAQGPRQGQLISGWTKQHARVAALAATIVAAEAAAAYEPGYYRLTSSLVIVVTVVAALFVDGFGGIVVGVAGAAAAITLKRFTGAWTDDTFTTSLALTVALVTVAWLAGMVSSDVHNRPLSRDPDAPLAAAQGSLGLLPGDAALARLEDEFIRARQHRRPLSVVVLSIHVTETLDAVARQSASRSVARLLETLLRDTDVPFALAPSEIGAILPETSGTDAWDVISPVLDAASHATFTVREQGERRSLADVAEVRTGLASLTDRDYDASALLAAARTSAQVPS